MQKKLTISIIITTILLVIASALLLNIEAITLYISSNSGTRSLHLNGLPLLVGYTSNYYSGFSVYKSYTQPFLPVVLGFGLILVSLINNIIIVISLFRDQDKKAAKRLAILNTILLILALVIFVFANDYAKLLYRSHYEKNTDTSVIYKYSTTNAFYYYIALAGVGALLSFIYFFLIKQPKLSKVEAEPITSLARKPKARDIEVEVCPICGNPLNKKDKFCTHCGKDILRLKNDLADEVYEHLK